MTVPTTRSSGPLRSPRSDTQARLPRGAEAQLARAVTDDPDPRARAAALAAVVQHASPRTAADAWTSAAHDGDAAVRRRAAELTPRLRRPPDDLPTTLAALLGDTDVTVVEAAALATGELAAVDAPSSRRSRPSRPGIARPSRREAAVAALGAAAAGLDTVLAACEDVATVRRRAVLALAPFDGPAVDAALARAATDRDWQVRQAAEDLLGVGQATPVELSPPRRPPSARGLIPPGAAPPGATAPTTASNTAHGATSSRSRSKPRRERADRSTEIASSAAVAAVTARRPNVSASAPCTTLPRG